MKIYSTLQRGTYHENYCEDSLYNGKYGKDKILCAVMDGCTSAMESHFASSLVSKILKKICHEKGYKEFVSNEDKKVNLEEEFQFILRHILLELKTIKNHLLLDEKELLTTLILLLLDKETQDGLIIAIGDGFVSLDGKEYVFDQDNKPDYLGFHVNQDFEDFYKNQKQILRFNNAKDISIATDGIFSFEPLKSEKRNHNFTITEFLSKDRDHSEKIEMLDLKLKYLEHQLGLKPTDDLGMIRILVE